MTFFNDHIEKTDVPSIECSIDIVMDQMDGAEERAANDKMQQALDDHACTHMVDSAMDSDDDSLYEGRYNVLYWYKA